MVQDCCPSPWHSGLLFLAVSWPSAASGTFPCHSSPALLSSRYDCLSSRYTTIKSYVPSYLKPLTSMRKFDKAPFALSGDSVHKSESAAPLSTAFFARGWPDHLNTQNSSCLYKMGDQTLCSLRREGEGTVGLGDEVDGRLNACCFAGSLHRKSRSHSRFAITLCSGFAQAWPALFTGCL